MTDLIWPISKSLKVPTDLNTYGSKYLKIHVFIQKSLHYNLIFIQEYEISVHLEIQSSIQNHIFHPFEFLFIYTIFIIYTKSIYLSRYLFPSPCLANHPSCTCHDRIKVVILEHDWILEHYRCLPQIQCRMQT